jgi:hypothetical protein
VERSIPTHRFWWHICPLESKLPPQTLSIDSLDQLLCFFCSWSLG